MSPRNKNPKVKKTITETKKPRIDSANLPQNILDKKPSWRFGRVDFHGEWGFHRANKADLIEAIHSKLIQFEKMKWNEIEGRKNHFVEINQLCKDAQKRLVKLQLQEFDPLFSLRLTGKERLWGIRSEEILYILWWDPNHSVCPSLKKHS